MTQLSAKTLRRLARSPYAPVGELPVLRTDALATLLLNRLMTLGPMTETAAVDALDTRAPGRGAETIQWACQRGLIQRVAGKDDEPATLKALGAPRSLAA